MLVNIKQKISIHVPTVVVSLIVMTACTSPNECLQNMDVAYKANFLQMTFDQGTESYVANQVSIVTSVHGLGKDSMLYDSARVNSIALPLQSNDTMSVFIIDQQVVLNNDTVMVADTLWVIHDNELEFVSVECGCAVKNNVRNVLHTVNMIDSVSRVTDNVNRNSRDNLKIYVKNR